VVAGTADGDTVVWGRASGRLLATSRHQSDYINGIELSPTGNTMLAASDDYTAIVYDCPMCVPLPDLMVQATTYLDELGPPYSKLGR
jgi:WD40 repeat protein